MTRECCKCHKELGEQCPDCSPSSAATLVGTHEGREIFQCNTCGKQFVKGYSRPLFPGGSENGKSHGYCEECLKEELAGIKS